ncbi:hypothetical protein J2R80_005897 [Bradyrhizobium sp. USDA 4541]|nr:hypothetical protein [Bradyrhizobium sp. USDA 4541]
MASARAIDRDALLLASGQPGRIGIALRLHADLLKQPFGRDDRLIPADPAHPHRGLDDVSQHRHVRPQIELLEHHSDFRPHLAGSEPHIGRWPGLRDRRPLHHDAPVGRSLQQRHASQKGRLA